MSSFAVPIKTAIALFPLLAFVFTLPFLIHQYRRYGSVPVLRSVVVYSFIFYLMAAWFMTVLPLPPVAEVAQMTRPYTQLIPFQFVKSWLEKTVLRLGNPSTYLPALRQGVFFHPAFNVLLLLPFGVYLRYYFKCSFKKTLLLAFGLSLFFELTQLSGLYGFYPRPYRLFDVDDLILNTLGGIVGYAMTPVFTFFLPNRDSIDRKAYTEGASAGVVRRGVALALDWFFVSLITAIISFVFDWHGLSTLLILFVYMIAIPYFTNGKTLGKAIVKVRVIENNAPKISLQALTKRYAWFYLGLPALSMGANWFGNRMLANENSPIYPFLVFASAGLYMVILLGLFALLVYFVVGFFQKKSLFFYEKWSDTCLISTIKLPKENGQTPSVSQDDNR